VVYALPSLVDGNTVRVMVMLSHVAVDVFRVSKVSLNSNNNNNNV